MMNFMVSADTDIGITKHSNQDSFHVRLCSGPEGPLVLAVICDGMGGLERGELASATMVDAFMKWADERLPELSEKPLQDEAVKEDWIRLLLENSRKIMAYARENGITMGTTVTALLLTGAHYFIIHVGDTRVYEIAQGLRVLTHDQTLVQREMDMGLLTPEEARTDPRRNVLLQCIGASENVIPDMITGSTRKDAVYMLCSDGFRHEISEEEICGCLGPENSLSPGQMKQNMRSLIELDKQRQETDNISVICIRTY